MDENSVMLRLERVRSKVSDAPSTISIAHPQAFESAFKHTPYSQKTRFFDVFQKFKKLFEKPLFRNFLFFSNMTTPVRPTELRKIFHRLTHIWSIRSQWNFFDSIFSYVRIIHCKPWNPFFFSVKAFIDMELFLGYFWFWKNLKDTFLGCFSILIQKVVLKLFYNSKEIKTKTRFWVISILNQKRRFGAVFRVEQYP